ncbi:hypothetical protein [Thiomonas sp. X19]|uniref:hypothetical protein n=1 Tax=Thiomonas sp. X19 TaxID=1050370 RepID=UPI0018ED9ACF
MAVAERLALAHRPAATVEVDRRLSSIWFATTLRPIGWTGPWAGRRGFDSLVQMSSGIAATGMRWQNATIPAPSGAGTRPRHGLFDGGLAIRGLTRRLAQGEATRGLPSLARSAKALMECDAKPDVTRPPMWVGRCHRRGKGKPVWTCVQSIRKVWASRMK